MRLLSRVAMWGLLICFPVGAHAGERHPDLEIGVGLICNSAAQVERYLALQNDSQSPDAAIRRVNDEVHDPNACALAAIAFTRGEQSKSIPVSGGAMKVTEVTIVAVQTQQGWERVRPLVQYTAIFEKLEEA